MKPKGSRSHVIEGDLDTIIFNPATSTTPKWRTFTLLRWLQKFHQSPQDHEILNADISSKDKQLLIRQFLGRKRTWKAAEN
jgi:hypothetical protein